MLIKSRDVTVKPVLSINLCYTTFNSAYWFQFARNAGKKMIENANRIHICYIARYLAGANHKLWWDEVNQQQGTVNQQQFGLNESICSSFVFYVKLLETKFSSQRTSHFQMNEPVVKKKKEKKERKSPGLCNKNRNIVIHILVMRCGCRTKHRMTWVR